jgi:alkylation response protein AidB-like acyl-CoA dehydrogenase
LSAEMLGNALEVFERIVDYLKQREQFGVLIGSFQGLQHRAATMYSELELCRSVVRRAFSELDGEQENVPALASVAKAKLSEILAIISNEGVQMHGGIGMTDEFDIGFYLKRARVAQQYLGDDRFHRDRYATLKGF